MSKMKFQNYSGLKNAQDNPRAIATTDLKNGQPIVYSVDSSNGKEYATLPTDATSAKAAKWFVWNTIDKPELDNESDFVIKSGEFARIFKMPLDELMDMSADLVTITNPAINDVLVPATSAGKYVVATASDTGYGFGLQIKEKTNFGGKGYTVRVITR